MDPIEFGESAFKKYLNNDLNNINKNNNNLNIITLKKINIFPIIEKVSINKIDTKDINEYKEKFREKYGISIKDIDDKKLEKEIKNNKFDEKKIIEIILRKLKLLKW